jgi:diaminopimelate epimerase
MGRVTFDSQEIPVKGPKRQVINETISLMGEDYRFSAASIGNPHCVFVKSEISEKETRELGPLIETDDRFPNKVNVQFCKVLDQNNIRIEIWERGAGYTLASGSSSSAAAAVVHKLGLCGSNLTVHMPGGPIEISITKDFNISMSGPVTKVAEGTTSQELFTKLPNILKS